MKGVAWEEEGEADEILNVRCRMRERREKASGCSVSTLRVGNVG